MSMWLAGTFALFKVADVSRECVLFRARVVFAWGCLVGIGSSKLAAKTGPRHAGRDTEFRVELGIEVDGRSYFDRPSALAKCA